MANTGPLRSTMSLLTAAASGSPPVTSIAPRSSAICSCDGLRSQPTISPANWLARSASPTEAPMRPVPTIVMRWMGMSSPRTPSGGPGDLSLYGPVHGRGDYSQLIHERCTLLREQRLRSIGKCLIRAGMNFDEQPVTAGGDRGAGHGRNLVAAPGTVRRISQHGQMRELLDHRYGGDVHGVASVGL